MNRTISFEVLLPADADAFLLRREIEHHAKTEDSVSRSFDWQSFFTILHTVGEVAGDITALATVAKLLYTKTRGLNAKLKRPSGEECDLENATEAEVLAWLLKQ